MIPLLFLIVPFLFFLLNVFDHHHYDPTSDLVFNLAGLALSTTGIILYLVFQNRKNKK
jgi:hypothetical protein